MRKLFGFLMLLALSVSCTIVGDTSLEGVWEETVESSTTHFWRVEFTGNEIYQNYIENMSDGTERVEQIIIGTYTVKDDSLSMIYTEGYESLVGTTFTSFINEGEVETVEGPFELTDEKLSIIGKDHTKVNKTLRKTP